VAVSSAEQRGEARSRDAARSRADLLAAAEVLFAERGYEATSLTEVGTAAGLSRGAASYFFGSKEGLYRAVLERAFAARDAATVAAFAPLREWSASPRSGSLRSALAGSVAAYMDFISGHPSFQKLVQREELAGGRRLRGVQRESSAIRDAFEALRSAAGEHGVRPFDVDDAVLVCVSLTYSPLAQRATFMAALGRDLERPATRRRHVDLVVDQLLAVLAGAGRVRR
jgi:AcrR family transcriptional regulator